MNLSRLRSFLFAPAVTTGAVFLLLTLFLVLIEARPNFPDPDSFYHAKMAMILRDEGPIHTFPWFQWTSLKDAFANPHLLYHVALIPFVSLFDPMVGMKLSAIVFGLFGFGAIWYALKRLGAPRPELFLLAGVLSLGLLERMSMPRAIAPAVGLIILATLFMHLRRPWITFFLSLLLTWFYHGYPVLFLSLLALIAAEWITEWTLSGSIRRACVSAWHRSHSVAFAILGGVATGIIVNPYFPTNLAFSIVDIFAIGVVNYHGRLPVGSEWHPMTVGEAVKAAGPALVLFGLCFALFFPGRFTKTPAPDREEISRIFLYTFLAGGYAVLSFKSFRYIEYQVPFLLILSGLLAGPAWRFWKEELWPFVVSTARAQLFIGPLLVGTVTATALVLVAGVVRPLLTSQDYFQSIQYLPAVEWINANVPEGEVIFHNSWDYSLILFYFDDTHRYLHGLDPTFMYTYDPDAFRLWQELVRGEGDLGEIERVFQSRTIIVDSRMDSDGAFSSHIEASGDYRLVVENEWVSVYTRRPL